MKNRPPPKKAPQLPPHAVLAVPPPRLGEALPGLQPGAQRAAWPCFHVNVIPMGRVRSAKLIFFLIREKVGLKGRFTCLPALAAPSTCTPHCPRSLPIPAPPPIPAPGCFPLMKLLLVTHCFMGSDLPSTRTGHSAPGPPRRTVGKPAVPGTGGCWYYLHT